ncbi:MAG: AbrB/MazE/SpoVT family DNA-binding domain-containing protein [Candidatus Baldrarchaeia archaeon]
MVIVKVTRNRQITIPSVISKKLGIREGTYVDVSLEGDKIVIRKIRSLEELAGSWKNIDINEIKKLIEERWRSWRKSV